MKLKLALAMMAALSPSMVMAQPVEPAATLKTTGEGQYEVWCAITPTSGDESTRYLQPGRDTLALSKVRRAECNYKTTSSGPVTVSLQGSEWACPFAAATEGTCQATFGKGTFGSFNLRRKQH